MKNRITSATKMNDKSSRSHSVLVLFCEKQRQGTSQMSKLYFVDLAGSERVKRSKVEGFNLQETNSINLSLTTLGKCIRQMGGDK